MEKETLQEGMAGKSLAEMNMHELRSKAGDAIAALDEAREEFSKAEDGATQAKAAYKKIDALVELVKVQNVELARLSQPL